MCMCVCVCVYVCVWIQLCDTRIDVVPLESGFSREARGRVIISNDHGSEALNYVCGDIGVRAIRMHKER